MARTEPLPGMENKRIPELTEAAEVYAKVRDKRIKLLADELEKKEILADLMHKHKLRSYRDEELTVTLENKEKVKVKLENGEDEE